MSSRDPVLIIGAGLGGLVLAQAFREANIPFRIFERDAVPQARTQGWAISLHPWLMSDLVSATYLDEKTLDGLCLTRALNLGSQGVIYSIADCELKTLYRFGSGTDNPFVRVSRGEFREQLLDSVTVEWGKTFKSYKEDETGVTAAFEDGTEIRGRILVGADGTSSRVRRQLAAGTPDAEPARLPIGLVIGQLVATRDQYERWMKLANSFCVGFADTRRLFVGVKDVAEDLKSAQYYWMFGWQDQEATKKDFWTTSASREDMHAYVMSHLDNLNEDFTEPIRQTPVEGILLPPIVMKDMVPPALPRGKVTLIGDAIHPMVPFRGEGGNMAMKDAISLTASLVEAGEASNLTDALKGYEEEMTERCTKSVLNSRASTFPQDFLN
ncbi:FAD/NAD(P)-binding domain-containing protein [Fusarium austroafricanum]|uniref:FAD/NAD(P)-binding domain-containing protein n=1 Tax=Fusarium austroafricanum TaxID=2364996 RepID=A0A8H4K682_9HYPO|nr:FAD/NAD(P)-binding domain-containing protein [Fusarium austroafricanum]